MFFWGDVCYTVIGKGLVLMSNRKLKYRPEDYPEIAYELRELEKEWNIYLDFKGEGNERIIRRMHLKDAIWNVRLGVKRMVLGRTLRQVEADEIVEYIWSLL